MIRSELIAKISEENPHLFQRDVEKIVNTIFDEITDRFNKEMFGSLGMCTPTLPSSSGEGGKPGIMALIQKIISS